MKKCPYCAEMIQDEAIKCRYCHSDLTVAPPSTGSTSTTSIDSSSSAAAQPAQTSSIRYTHSGYRYVLGYATDFFGIWDRQAPSVEAERFARSDDGWRDAWLRFAALEPNHTTVPADGGATGGTTPGSSAASAAMSPVASSAGASTESTAPQQAATTMDPDDTDAVQYTHSGTRYLLGYGRTFFGIWDRQAPERPVERFPRDDPGWAAAWGRYTQMETNFSEVKLG